jgi:hypothetical protein
MDVIFNFPCSFFIVEYESYFWVRFFLEYSSFILFYLLYNGFKM